ncbi:MAG: hypothetical protein L6R36_001408 [Xanthoria steineri]|nr:MAG: hypothetical protein L6R36_001408 [Xanthoria steineri]
MPPIAANNYLISCLRPKSAYVCPSCCFRNAINPLRKAKRPAHRVPVSAPRRASTIASVTAVNAKKDIPHAFHPLYEALAAVQREAAVYSNLSQIQLALRGLESENAITRIAVLGGPDGTKTRRLVKALLADPLLPEQEWEKHLLSLDDSDGRALLLRYGEQLAIDRSHPLVRTLSLPSLTLHTHNLEILVQAASSQTEDEGSGIQMYLTPGLETPSSATGRFSTVMYPVHKALVIAQGLDTVRPLLALGSTGKLGVGEDMVTVAVDSPWDKLSSAESPLRPIHPINLQRAEEAITTFRQSLDNSFNYEHAWFESGLPKLFTWLTEGTEVLPSILKPTIRRLIETLAANAEQALEREESAQLQKQASSVIPTSTRDTLNHYLANWAEAAHTELRDGLDTVFNGKKWRKLVWWKLFWRVDDVSYILSDTLRQSWLLDADRGIIYLAGRIEQAGLLPARLTNPYQVSSMATRPDPGARSFGTIPPTPRLSDLIPSTASPAPSPTTHPLSLAGEHTPSHPIPSISHMRLYLLATAVPPMQSLANRLLMHCLSTTFLTSSLSALLYVSISTTSIYEAGGIAAVGAVVALRRLQKRWEAARGRWVVLLREEGRRVLRRVEDGWRGVVRDGGMGDVEDEGEREGREKTRRVVREVRERLD